MIDPAGLCDDVRELVADHRWLVRLVVAHAGDVPRAVGEAALLDAAASFVSGGGVSFPRYAWRIIERAVREHACPPARAGGIRSRAAEAFVDGVQEAADPWTLSAGELAISIEAEAWGLLAAKITGAVLDAHATPVDAERWGALIRVVGDAIEALTEPDLLVLDMRYREGASFGVIGEKLSPPETACGAALAHRDALMRFGRALRGSGCGGEKR